MTYSCDLYFLQLLIQSDSFFYNFTLPIIVWTEPFVAMMRAWVLETRHQGRTQYDRH